MKYDINSSVCFFSCQNFTLHCYLALVDPKKAEKKKSPCITAASDSSVFLPGSLVTSLQNHSCQNLIWKNNIFWIWHMLEINRKCSQDLEINEEKLFLKIFESQKKWIKKNRAFHCLVNSIIFKKSHKE